MQYTVKQRISLIMDYFRLQGKQGMWDEIIINFITAFPDARPPSKASVCKMVKKSQTVGTVHNLNSKVSPSDTHSGRRRTERTERNARFLR